MRNHNLSRAGLKREARRFKVGDTVTWGSKACSHVVEVTRTGLFVDVTGEKMRSTSPPAGLATGCTTSSPSTATSSVFKAATDPSPR